MFKYVFCKPYFKKHKKWHDVEQTGTIPNLIKKSVDCNKWFECESRPWDPLGFRHIKFKKNFEFDYHVDPSDLLTDKAIDPSLKHWIYEYDTQA